MVDFHSHILPCMDDGSGSVKESIAMLRESARQGVSIIFATPHFYASENTPDEFLMRRQFAWQQLQPCMQEELPAVRLGAEVHYWEGISRSDAVFRLQLEGTPLLLLEMPMIPWTQRMLDAVLELNGRRDITVLLAHIERYLSLQPHQTWPLLRQEGVCMQVNASFLLNRKTRRKALTMLKKREYDVIGSDCHRSEDGRNRMGDTRQFILGSLGRTGYEWINRQERSLLSGM